MSQKFEEFQNEIIGGIKSMIDGLDEIVEKYREIGEVEFTEEEKAEWKGMKEELVCMFKYYQECIDEKENNE